MKRFTIEAMVWVDIEADDAETAYEHFYDGLERIEGTRDCSVSQVNQEEVPYLVPDGMQRWSVAMINVRLGEETGARSAGPVEGSWDGSWWWSNGHLLLRCEGSAPTGDGWKHLSTDELEKAIVPGAKRRPTVWGDVVESVSGFVHARISAEDKDIGIQQRYHSTIEASLGPGVTWHVGKKTQPMHALDAEGRLMAVVMPMLTDKLVTKPAAVST